MRKNFLMKVSAFLTTAVMAVSAGAFTASANSDAATIELTGAQTLAGKIANVDYNIFSGNECEGYTFVVEFDDNLTFKRVNGGATYEQYDNTVYISGFSAYALEDGKAGSITFEVPEDAMAGETYDIRIMQVEELGSTTRQFRDVKTINTEISVLESAQASNSKTSIHMVFVTEVAGDVKVQVGMRGDANGDGVVNIFDALAVAKNSVSSGHIKSDANKFFGNVNEDGKLDIFDALKIARFSMNGNWK